MFAGCPNERRRLLSRLCRDYVRHGIRRHDGVYEATSHRLRRLFHGLERHASGQFGAFRIGDAGAGNAHSSRQLGAGHAKRFSRRPQPPFCGPP